MKMLFNVLRNFFGKSSTRNYPAEVRPAFKNSRGELINNIDDCIFCGNCSRKCPSQCITVDKKDSTWGCDPFLCVYCGVCVESCPTSCIHQEEHYRAPSRVHEYILMKGEADAKKRKTKKAA